MNFYPRVRYDTNSRNERNRLRFRLRSHGNGAHRFDAIRFGKPKSEKSTPGRDEGSQVVSRLVAQGFTLQSPYSDTSDCSMGVEDVEKIFFIYF